MALALRTPSAQLPGRPTAEVSTPDSAGIGSTIGAAVEPIDGSDARVIVGDETSATVDAEAKRLSTVVM